MGFFVNVVMDGVAFSSDHRSGSGSRLAVDRVLRTVSTLLAALIPLSACVSYRIISEPTVPPPGTHVRATLSGPGALRTSGLFGRPIQQIEGEFLGVGADSVLLGVVRFAEFGRQHARMDTLALPRSDVARFEERRLSATKTAFAVGASSVVIGAVAIGLFRAAGGSGNDQGGDEDRIRIPLFFRMH
jgi:hypothetical protein